ncbi:hypothetical protein [Pelomonas aquatica]|uniref:Uncharacterized protein n=1 Tax=Pelomonas aquatica TaxID=431058 RepID=A0A9X4LK02_9BURK|nr:hypothetical protein [Pelomonas aquatica]MCY4754465.1 hypothetical protein [Pelomonas aquatica]MDG0861488.1 hypothetical protein [Pelomonas aquatica]
MAAIPLAKTPLAALKKLVLDDLIQVKSSHVTEALAYALGFRTYAALQASMTGSEEDRPFVLLDTDRFLDRIRSFGYELRATLNKPLISTLRRTDALLA